MNWQTEGEGSIWLPVLNAAEDKYGIPHNLLARVAYEESHFRADIITGAVKSSVGAVGIMQLMPQFFINAGQDPTADIETAAHFLASLYVRFKDWSLAVAAYNDGPGNIHAYLAGTKELPDETKTYVAQITTDVPVGGQLQAEVA